MDELDEIGRVQKLVGNARYFNWRSGQNYIRLLDTPRVWGLKVDRAIMPTAWALQRELERAVEEIVQKSRYRCDVSSAGCPDPDWAGVIIGAMDTALTKPMGRAAPTQFRFLFGQTPRYPRDEPPNYTLFKQALIRLVRDRGRDWEMLPDIWLGRFRRLRSGILTAAGAEVFSGDGIWSDFDAKMTWNHSKIVAADATEALAGGHDLNAGLLRSYPPVHDVSIVMHGPAAHAAHAYLDEMWASGSDLLATEQLDPRALSWQARDPDTTPPADPFRAEGAAQYVEERQMEILELHAAGVPEAVPAAARAGAGSPDSDLAALPELTADVFPLRELHQHYDAFAAYKPATGVLAVGKYWTSSGFQDGSELMKRELIQGARRSIRISQMDLVSGWKSQWSDHKVCQWVLQALLDHPNLTVQVVVSPLDAGAGAGGDQYSFGSGAVRTFELMQYYMTHDAQTDEPLPDAAWRAQALSRLFVAPLCYTDVPAAPAFEETAYKWPDLPQERYTATLRQPSLSEVPPDKGIIRSAALSVINERGYLYKKIRSAPGNHAKLMVIDDEAYVVGSDDLFPGFLSEFDYLIEGKEAVGQLLKAYWEPLWRYSSPHARTLVSPPPPPQPRPQPRKPLVPGAAPESALATFSAPQQQVFYIGFDGHVHQLRFDGRWLHADLTVAAEAPPAEPAGGLVTTSAPQQQVCYTGTDGHLHQLRYDSRWLHTDLSRVVVSTSTVDAPPAAPGGGLATLSLPERPVYYIGTDGHVYALWSAHAKWRHWDDLVQQAGAPELAAAEGALAALGSPWQQVFYIGADGHVYQLWNDGRWQCADRAHPAGAPAAVAAAGLATFSAQQQQVCYIGRDGHVHQLWFEGYWKYTDLVQLTGAPPVAAGGLTSLGSADRGAFYTGSDGHVYQLAYADPWYYTDLTPMGDAPAATVAGLAAVDGPEQQVYYVGADGHVYLLSTVAFSDDWSRTDLTKTAVPG